MRGSSTAAIENPIARVLPLLDVPHLDRIFDYSVPHELSDVAQPGVRVQVRFSGRLVEGYIVERVSTTDFGGTLAPLRKVYNSHSVFIDNFRDLVEWTSRYYAGTRSDVLRLAIPKRVARVDNEDFLHADPLPITESVPLEEVIPTAHRERWKKYRFGESMLKALSRKAVTAAWQLVPGEDIVGRVSDVVRIARTQNGSVLILVPDQFDLEPLYAQLQNALGDGGVGRLASEDGPTNRYRTWLNAFYGNIDVIVGTRSAAFVPLKNLHTIIIFDDGNDIYVDPRAPYPHAREVLFYRSRHEKANFVSASWMPSLHTMRRLQTGTLQLLAPERGELKSALPRISAPGDSDQALERDPLARAARIPQVVFNVVRKALKRDEPVVFQVPRRGNVPGLMCQSCHEKARCRHCGGPLMLPERANVDTQVFPTCSWCGVEEKLFTCTHCGSHSLRASVKGASRTAEELGRAFPGIPILLSYGDRDKRRTTVASKACVVVSTPGSEPVANGGYGAAVMLDAWVLLDRPELSADEDTARKWWNLVSKVKPHQAGGEVIIVGAPSHPVIQGMIRGNSVELAMRMLGERAEVQLPPLSHFIAIDGDYAAVADFVRELNLDDTDGVSVLGPMDIPAFERLPASEHLAEPTRMVIKTGESHLANVVDEIRKTIRYRSTDAKNIPVRVHVDPIHLG